MKINLNKVFYKIIFLLFCLVGYLANANPPNPMKRGIEPPADDLPINGNLIILFIVAVLFGLYIIYNYNINKKRAI